MRSSSSITTSIAVKEGEVNSATVELIKDVLATFLGDCNFMEIQKVEPVEGIKDRFWVEIKDESTNEWEGIVNLENGEGNVDIWGDRGTIEKTSDGYKAEGFSIVYPKK